MQDNTKLIEAINAAIDAIESALAQLKQLEKHNK